MSLGQFTAVLLDGGHLRAYALMSFLVLGMFTIVPFMATYLVVNVGCAESNLKYMYLCGGLDDAGNDAGDRLAGGPLQQACGCFASWPSARWFQSCW